MPSMARTAIRVLCPGSFFIHVHVRDARVAVEKVSKALRDAILKELLAPKMFLVTDVAHDKHIETHLH